MKTTEPNSEPKLPEVMTDNQSICYRMSGDTTEEQIESREKSILKKRSDAELDI